MDYDQKFIETDRYFKAFRITEECKRDGYEFPKWVTESAENESDCIFENGGINPGVGDFKVRDLKTGLWYVQAASGQIYIYTEATFGLKFKPFYESAEAKSSSTIRLRVEGDGTIQGSRVVDQDGREVERIQSVGWMADATKQNNRGGHESVVTIKLIATPVNITPR